MHLQRFGWIYGENMGKIWGKYGEFSLFDRKIIETVKNGASDLYLYNLLICAYLTVKNIFYILKDLRKHSKILLAWYKEKPYFCSVIKHKQQTNGD